MSCRHRSSRQIFAGWSFLLGWFLILTTASGASWQIVMVQGRQYLPLRNLQDFYGLTASSGGDGNQVRLRGSKGVIDFRANSRECAINGVRIWLSFPAVKSENAWLVSRMDVAKTIEPALRPLIIKGLGKVTTVVLDAGHGGHDGGAASVFGSEKTFALDIARRVKTKLQERGFKVILTRNSDVFIPLQNRPAVANTQPSSIFVSIHFNASQQGDTASGIEVFSIAPRGAPSTNDDYLTWAALREEPGHQLDMASFALGRAIHTAMMGHLHEVDRGLKRARFAVIRTARVPAVLVECGFLTNPAEARAIATDAHRDAIATAISDGISDYKLLADRRRLPRNLADYNKAIDTQITLRDDHEAGVSNEMESTALVPKVSALTPLAFDAGSRRFPMQRQIRPEAPIGVPFVSGRYPFDPSPSGPIPLRPPGK